MAWERGDFERLGRLADAAERIADALEAIQLKLPVARDDRHGSATKEAERADQRVLARRENERRRG